MTEPNFRGSVWAGKGKFTNSESNNELENNKQAKQESQNKEIDFESREIENYKKAGKIAREVRDFAKSIIKKDEKLIEIAEKIEAKILELGGKPAFPCNLSINEIAAHYTPSTNDATLASGLLKIDFGVHISGCIVDVAFSVDLENDEENKKLIRASENALESAIRIIKPNIEIWKIGREIQEAISKLNFSPIRNLSGHELGKYKVHSGLTIPNTNNNNKNELKGGAYAIEPFSTSGLGIVYDGKPSSIYVLKEKKAVRNQEARKLLAFIEDEYKTLPFCERWLTKKFPRTIFLLSLLEKERILHQYPQLVEKSHEKVSQAETTILVTDRIEILV